MDDGTVSCLECKEGFVYTTSWTSNYLMMMTCNLPEICPPGQFNAFNFCYPCENSCEECHMKNIFDFSTYTCTKCYPGFQPDSQQGCSMANNSDGACPVGTYLPPTDPIT